MDRQSLAYRDAGPADWWTLDDLPVVQGPIRSVEDWEADDWDIGRLGSKSLALAKGALALRVLDPTAPDDDPHAYDDLAYPKAPRGGPVAPRGGGVWVPWLVDAARTTGYPVIEVPGQRTRGHGGMRVVEGVMGHHTATSARAAGDYPSLRVVRDGRTGLKGPLCNLGLGRSGTIYVVAAGCAYHAGASRHAGFVDLNDEFLGIEAEDDGDGTWTAQQRDAYPKLVGALLKYMRRGVDRYVSHRGAATPPGRKPDPAGLDDQWMRTGAARWISGGGGTPPPPAPTVGADTHTVAAGDTLWGIARRYGVTVEQLRTWNGLTADTLTIGKVLRVRAPGGAATHRVVAGDTLWALARRYGVSVDQLRSWNDLRGDVLTIGRELRVRA